MTCEDDTAELLRRAGHKMTPQRLLIVRSLRHAGGHLTAAQITEQVRERTRWWISARSIARSMC